MLLAVDPVVASWFPISSPLGILATLSTVCAFVFWFEKVTNWRIFQIIPSVALIYLIPLVMTNTGILQPRLPIIDLQNLPWLGILGAAPAVVHASGTLAISSPVFDAMDRIMLPMMLILLLLNVNLRGAVRVMGRGVGVMLVGSVGVIVGALLSCLLVHRWLGRKPGKPTARSPAAGPAARPT